MKKSFKKLLAKTSLLSMLSFAPISKAEKIDIDSSINNSISNQQAITQENNWANYNAEMNYNASNNNPADKEHKTSVAPTIVKIGSVISSLATACFLFLNATLSDDQLEEYLKIDRATLTTAIVSEGICFYLCFREINNKAESIAKSE